MRLLTAQPKKFALACAALAAAVLASALCAEAQSSLLEAPTPVTGNEIAGRIPALDVGDSRLTRHFYTLNARPGDLELTVTASNLEGDIDLFSAAAMRPLTKVTLYGGSDTTVARTVFFRRDETLILRVEARTPNDAEGSYRIRFGGTFVASTAPAPEEPAGASESSPASAPVARPNARGTYRVNSVGARIEEPKPEVAAAASPTPAEAGPAGEAAPPKPSSARTNTARGRAAARREAARREAARRAGTTAATSDAGKTEAAKDAPAERDSSSGETPRTEPARTGTSRARPNRTRAPRAGASDRAAANAPPSADTPAPPSAEPTTGEPAALGLEAPGARLVLELRDGTSVVREMSEVRRVAVEGRLVVVTLKNGRVERQPLSNVRRMSIEP